MEQRGEGNNGARQSREVTRDETVRVPEVPVSMLVLTQGSGRTLESFNKNQPDLVELVVESNLPISGKVSLDLLTCVKMLLVTRTSFSEHCRPLQAVWEPLNHSIISPAISHLRGRILTPPRALPHLCGHYLESRGKRDEGWGHKERETLFQNSESHQTYNMLVFFFQ